MGYYPDDEEHREERQQDEELRLLPGSDDAAVIEIGQRVEQQLAHACIVRNGGVPGQGARYRAARAVTTRRTRSGKLLQMLSTPASYIVVMSSSPSTVQVMKVSERRWPWRTISGVAIE